MKLNSIFYVLLFTEVCLSVTSGALLYPNRNNARLRFSDSKAREEIRRDWRVVRRLRRSAILTEKSENSLFSNFASKEKLKKQLPVNDFMRSASRIRNKYDKVNFRERKRNTEQSHLPFLPGAKKNFKERKVSIRFNSITSRDVRKIAELYLNKRNARGFRNVRNSFRKERVIASYRNVDIQEIRRTDSVRFIRNRRANVRAGRKLESVRINLKQNNIRRTSFLKRSSNQQTHLRISKLKNIRPTTRIKSVPDVLVRQSLGKLYRDQNHISHNRRIIRASYNNLKKDANHKSYLDKNLEKLETFVVKKPLKPVKYKQETEKRGHFISKYSSSLNEIIKENSSPAIYEVKNLTQSDCLIFSTNRYSNRSLAAHVKSKGKKLNIDKLRILVLQMKRRLEDSFQSFKGNIQDKGTIWNSEESTQNYSTFNVEAYKWYEERKAMGIINGAIVTLGLTLTVANLQKSFHLPFLDYCSL